MEKSRGSRIEPWGTPQLSGSAVEEASLIDTENDQSDR